MVEEFAVMDAGQIDAALGAAASAFSRWRATPVSDRAARLRDAGAVLRRRRDDLAATITREMGKTIAEAEAEVEKCAFCCDYYADNAARFLADEAFPSDSARSFVAYAPIGPVLAIMPWNFPLWQAFRALVPALCAGNVMLLKHAGNVSRCAINIESVLSEAGLPSGVFTTLLIDGPSASELVADPRIRGVTLTGSDATGARVAGLAGEHLKKTVLELGGSDAYIVLEDADLGPAASTAVRSRFQNAGQSCISAKRFIVVASVAEEFEERMVAETTRLRVGEPRSRETQMGPLAREDLRAELERQLAESVSAGAEVRTGGRRRGERGWFFEPTVLTGCTPEMTVFREETFGPLAAVMRVANDEHAVDVANASVYGLGGNIWTRDIDRGTELARRLDTGGVFINGMTHSDPRLPFGGVKRSGYGRELSSVGIREFTNVQTIWMPDGDAAGSTPGAAASGTPGVE
jgi:acyl-CoA reductase-like NAD-dependent aldehyde dehydrogenase